MSSSFIQDGIPYFSSNDLIRSWLFLDIDLKIFFKFFTSPFEISLHRKATLKYDKYKKPLNLRLKKTKDGQMPIKYNPKKHNVYYFRSRRMLFTLMVKKNINMMLESNSNAVKLFCNLLLTSDETLRDEVINRNKSQADLNHVMLFIQFLFILDPTESTKGILTNHFLFDMLAHVEYRFVRETLVSLLTPNDPFLKLPPHLHAAIVEYCRLTGVCALLLTMVSRPNDAEVYEAKQRLTDTAGIEEAVDAIIERISPRESAPNFFVRMFNGFILGKFNRLTVTQPEEQTIGMPNIDGLPSNVYAKMNKRPNSGYGLSADMLKLSNKLFDIQADSSKAPKFKLELEEKKKTNGFPSMMKKSHTMAIQEIVAKEEPKPKLSLLKKSMTKVLNMYPFSSKIKKQAPITADKGDMPGTIYPEKIQTYNVKVFQAMKFFLDNLEFNLKKERFLTCLIECITAILTTPLHQEENQEMAKLLNQPASRIETVSPLFFSTTDFYAALVSSFTVRLEYVIINNAELSSVATNSKLICLILKHQ